MEDIIIKVGKTDWQFLEKDSDSGIVEVANLETKDQYKGFIKTMKSNGTYIIELKEQIQ